MALLVGLVQDSEKNQDSLIESLIRERLGRAFHLLIYFVKEIMWKVLTLLTMRSRWISIKTKKRYIVIFKVFVRKKSTKFNAKQIRLKMFKWIPQGVDRWLTDGRWRLIIQKPALIYYAKRSLWDSFVNYTRFGKLNWSIKDSLHYLS